MAVRLYFTNSAAAITPAAIRGNWNDKTLSGLSALSTTKAGANTTAVRAETSPFGNQRVLLRRFVSPRFTNAATMTGDWQAVLGHVESATAANLFDQWFIYVVNAEDGSIRGVFANGANVVEHPTVANGGSIVSAGSSVDCRVNDYLVVEIGYQATNTSITSYSGTIYYGGTGATDLAAASTAVTLNPGWIELPLDVQLGPPARFGSTTSTLGSTATALGRKAQTGTTSTGLTLAQVTRHAFPTATTLGLSSTASGGKNAAGSTTTALALASSGTATRATAATAVTTIGLHEPGAGRHVTAPVATTSLMNTRDVPYAIHRGGTEVPPTYLERVTAPYRPPTRKPLRFIAQAIRNGTWVTWDLPVIDPEITFALSGPTMIRGLVGPDHMDLDLTDVDAWATWIHVEDNGIIRASGIVQPLAVDDEMLVIEAAGVTAYPQGLPYSTELSEIQIDPLEVVRRIWAHVQDYPDAKLGVTVAATASPQRLGTPVVYQRDERGNIVLDENGFPIVEDEAEPYELHWWDDSDCGSEIDSLATSTPFDYVEQSWWNQARTEVIHHVDLGYPRLGTRRNDLRFAEGENIINAVVLQETPDHFASEVIFRGAGEGRAAVRGYVAARGLRRLRRIAIFGDQTVTAKDRAIRLARDELLRRSALFTLGAVEIDPHHENAPLGSFALGDDILIQAQLPWFGNIALWHRIIAYTWAPDSDVVVLELRRSDQFNYGTAASS